MPCIPKRSKTGAAGIKKYQPVLALAKNKDVTEPDTVAILNDLLADVFGYAKYFEVTSEFSIRGTYWDLAIKLDNKITVLIEAKAIGGELKAGDRLRGKPGRFDFERSSTRFDMNLNTDNHF